MILIEVLPSVAAIKVLSNSHMCSTCSEKPEILSLSWKLSFFIFSEIIISPLFNPNIIYFPLLKGQKLFAAK